MFAIPSILQKNFLKTVFHFLFAIKFIYALLFFSIISVVYWYKFTLKLLHFPLNNNLKKNVFTGLEELDEGSNIVSSQILQSINKIYVHLLKICIILTDRGLFQFMNILFFIDFFFIRLRQTSLINTHLSVFHEIKMFCAFEWVVILK